MPRWFLPSFVVLSGCMSTLQPTDEYRESHKGVSVFPVKTSDNYLRIVTFVRLADSSIQRPRLYYYQTHHTVIGVKRVEKPGRLWSVVTKERNQLHLPVSDHISDYLFLISKPIVSEVEKDGVKKTVTEWTEWFVLEAPAEKVIQKKMITFPLFENLEQNAGGDQDLLKQLRAEYAKAEAAGKAKMDTPVKSRSEVPWYAQ
jgi:hypothetical protein